MLFFLRMPCFTITRLPLAGEVGDNSSGTNLVSVLFFLSLISASFSLLLSFASSGVFGSPLLLDPMPVSQSVCFRFSIALRTS